MTGGGQGRRKASKKDRRKAFWRETARMAMRASLNLIVYVLQRQFTGGHWF